MSLNDTPSGERLHIAFLGRRNTGKSSLVNAFTGQDLSVVSDVRGTTTDPVTKAMELLPLGPVQIIDTPGFDDEGDLGALRVGKTRQVLRRADIALLVTDAAGELDKEEAELLERLRARQIPCLVVRNKADLHTQLPPETEGEIWVSARTGANIQALKERVARLVRPDAPARPLVADLFAPGDLAVLVVPIDKAAPKGRLILPQQQVIRDALEAGAMPLVVRDTELALALERLPTPRLVITDSQAFAAVAKIVPSAVPLTSFSILMARYKGDLPQQVAGARAVDGLRDGDRVLIAEGCTHHRQCEDIGTVKLPRWIEARTGVKPDYTFTSGTEFPEDLSPYRMVVHCGGCTLNGREMKYRLGCAREQGVPMTNYGVLIAYLNGILARTLEPFPDLAALLKGGPQA